MRRKGSAEQSGFTLIEMVMVMVILGILAAIALPTFFNLQEQAKVSAVKGALGGMRSGISIWYAKQAASGTPTWPTLGELSTDVMAGGVIPANPFSTDGTLKNIVAGTEGSTDTSDAWIYDVATGRLWATNSDSSKTAY